MDGQAAAALSKMTLHRDKVTTLRCPPEDKAIGEGDSRMKENEVKPFEDILLPSESFNSSTTPLHRCMGHHCLPVLGEEVQVDYCDPASKAAGKSAKMIAASTRTV